MVPHFKMQPYFHGSISLHFFVCSLKYLGVQFEIFLIYKQNYIQCYKNGVSALSFFSYRFTKQNLKVFQRDWSIAMVNLWEKLQLVKEIIGRFSMLFSRKKNKKITWKSVVIHQRIGVKQNKNRFEPSFLLTNFYSFNL